MLTNGLSHLAAGIEYRLAGSVHSPFVSVLGENKMIYILIGVAAMLLFLLGCILFNSAKPAPKPQGARTNKHQIPDGKLGTVRLSFTDYRDYDPERLLKNRSERWDS